MQHAIRVVIAVCFALLCCHFASAQCQYEVTIIEGEPCGMGELELPRRPSVRAIAGPWVAGNYPFSCLCCGGEPFVWSEETGFIFFETPENFEDGHVSDIAIGPDGELHIVGWMRLIPGGDWGFRVEDGELVPLPVPEGAIWSDADGVSPSGKVIGTTPNLKGQGINATLWEDDQFSFLNLPHGTTGVPHDINDEEDIVGSMYHSPWVDTIPFRWSQDSAKELPMLDDWLAAGAGGIATETITGTAKVEMKDSEFDFNRASKWDGSNAELLEHLEEFDMGGSIRINSSGVIIGEVTNLSEPDVAVIWVHGEIHKLIDLIDDPKILAISDARDIKEDGTIAASGTEFGVGGASFLLTPIDPSPADITGDCRTDQHDLLRLLEEWGTDSIADYDNSGSVGVPDLLFLLGHWTIK